MSLTQELSVDAFLDIKVQRDPKQYTLTQSKLINQIIEYARL
jgi:hypothetical protein